MKISTTETRREEDSVDNLDPTKMFSSDKAGEFRSAACYSDDCTQIGVERVRTPADYDSVARNDSLQLLEPKLPEDINKPITT